jgi:hypothetical protein
MMDSKLSESSVLVGEAEWTTNSSIECCIQDTAETDWRIYLGLGENFRSSMTKLFCQIINKSGEDPALLTEETERSAKTLAWLLTHRFVLNINEDIENYFRAEYAPITEKIIAEHLPVEISRFLSELGV